MWLWGMSQTKCVLNKAMVGASGRRNSIRSWVATQLGVKGLGVGSSLCFGEAWAASTQQAMATPKCKCKGRMHWPMVAGTGLLGHHSGLKASGSQGASNNNVVLEGPCCSLPRAVRGSELAKGYLRDVTTEFANPLSKQVATLQQEMGRRAWEGVWLWAVGCNLGKAQVGVGIGPHDPMAAPHLGPGAFQGLLVKVQTGCGG